MAQDEVSTAVRIDYRDNFAIVWIDRPAQRNALNLAVKKALCLALEKLAADPKVRVVVLAGSQGRFVSGTDVAEMADMQPDDHARLETGHVFAAAAAFPKPMIAAVERYAFGGGLELALCCDIIIADEGARLALPEITLGIMPGGGGTQRMLRSIGHTRTMLHVLTGKAMSGRDAASMGLISEAVEDGSALARALDYGAAIAAMPQGSIAAIKRTMAYGASHPLDNALGKERAEFVDLFGSRDQKEGMRAFLDKRPAHFT